MARAQGRQSTQLGNNEESAHIQFTSFFYSCFYLVLDPGAWDGAVYIHVDHVFPVSPTATPEAHFLGTLKSRQVDNDG